MNKELSHLCQEFKYQNFKVCFESILFRLILRHLQQLDMNCYWWKWKCKWKRMKNQLHKVKGQQVFMMMIEHCCGKIKMTWWCFKNGLSTNILISKCGLLTTNLLTRAMQIFLMIIHNDEIHMIHILYVLVTWG